MSAIDGQRFTALGQEWEVRFDFNAMCDIEERTGEPFMASAAPFLALIDENALGNEKAMVQVASRVSFGNMRQLLHWVLLPANSDLEKSEVGEIVNEIGLTETVAVLATAIAKAIPQGGDAAGDENPPTKRSKRRKAAKAG